MTGPTIFPELTIERRQLAWADYLDALTPVEQVEGVWLKRDDAFAPLGYGGINGAKLRQLIWLVERYWKGGGRTGIVTGASSLSPQLSMGALVGRHYGLPVTIVLGKTTVQAASRYESVAIALEAGADIELTPVAFNTALQKATRDLAASRPGSYMLPYGITTTADADPADVEAFHAVGARQVDNVPHDVDTIVIPAGSCNSCVSVLYGIATRRPALLRRVVLVGIGPTRLQWIEDRLAAIESVTGEPIRGVFRRRYYDHPVLEEAHSARGGSGEYLLEHWDLHSTGQVRYSDRVPWELGGVVFHPTYEGKVLAWLERNRDQFGWFWESGRALLWVIGSEPSRAAMVEALDGQR